MKFITFIALAGASLPFARAAAIEAAEESLEESDFTFDAAMELTWTGPVSQGGENVTLTGSIESIYEQLKEINPNFDEELGDEQQQNAEATFEERMALEKRGPTNDNSINCNVGDKREPGYYQQGIDHLRRVGGTCRVDRGPRTCVRTTCNNGAAIWLCNDKNRAEGIPCHDVADNASAARRRCFVEYWYAAPRGKGVWVRYTAGQIFSFDGTWNVILRSC